MLKSLHLKKDDQVMVISGKEKGKTGKILKTIPKKQRVLVEKINIVKRHTRPGSNTKGGILEKELPVHVSKLKLICNKCNKQTRIGKKYLEDGKKVIVCKKCKEVIEN